MCNSGKDALNATENFVGHWNPVSSGASGHSPMGSKEHAYKRYFILLIVDCARGQCVAHA